MATTKNPTAAEIWNTLSQVDVNEHTQDKGGLTYLSWAWAWGVMMKHYPNLSIEWHGNSETGTDAITYPGGTVMVSCTVTIGYEGTSAVRRTMWLPVMDYRNKAITNPDTRAISDSKMRCMTKCFALFGLGHYIYAGEDLPRAATGMAAPSPSVEDIAEASKITEELTDVGTSMSEAGITIEPSLRKAIKEAMKENNPAGLKAVLTKLKKLQEDN